jgi:hypothetical protein
MVNESDVDTSLSGRKWDKTEYGSTFCRKDNIGMVVIKVHYYPYSNYLNDERWHNKSTIARENCNTPSPHN